MSDRLLFYSVLGLVAVSGMLAAYAVESARRAVPNDNRRYMDPLPVFVRLIWPLVAFFSHYVGERAGIEYLEWIRLHLRRSGLNYMVTPEQFVGLQCVASAFGGLAALVLYDGAMLGTLSFVFPGMAAGAVLPFIKVKDRRKKREKEIIRALPVYLDFVTMAVEAGMNINGAFMQAVEKGPEGPLKTELQSVLRDINAGMGRIDALRAMADRLDIREITTLVSALVQAEHTGGSVANALRIQGEQRRVERFQRAEKQALEAPVKLVFPLVAFIFPTTFVILFFPIVMRFIHDM